MPKVTPFKHDKDSLGAIRDQITGFADKLQASIETMKSNDLEILVVPKGQPELIRGMKRVSLFCNTVEIALIDTLDEKGKYEAKAKPSKAK